MYMSTVNPVKIWMVDSGLAKPESVAVQFAPLQSDAHNEALSLVFRDQLPAAGAENGIGHGASSGQSIGFAQPITDFGFIPYLRFVLSSIENDFDEAGKVGSARVAPSMGKTDSWCLLCSGWMPQR